MIVKEIIKQWLIDNKYEGLLCDACGCYLEDLMPCDEGYGDCEPAIMKKCEDGCEATIEECPNEYDSNQRKFGYCMVSKKI